MFFILQDPKARAVCQYCGYTSVNKLQCDRCNRKFTSATKYVIEESKNESDSKRRKIDGVIVTDFGGVDKKSFYSRSLKEQNQVYLQVFETVSNKNIKTLRPVTAKRGRGRGRGRGVVVHSHGKNFSYLYDL